MPGSSANAQGDGGYFVCGKGDAEGQAQKYEHGKLDEAGTAARQRGKHVGDQGDDENKQVFKHCGCCIGSQSFFFTGRLLCHCNIVLYS